MIKLIISDMDGTFLNSKGVFNSSHFKQVLDVLKKDDITFAACTGKQCERVEELFGDLANDIWILGDSATRIKHQGEFVYESLIPNTLGLSVIRKLETISSDHVIIACTPSAAYILKSVNQENTTKVRGSYTVVKQVDKFEEIDEDFVKITIYDSTEKCFETSKQLSPFEKELNIVVAEHAWIDISNLNVHKGTTVQRLQKILAVEKNETISFGDGYNDLDLFKESGISFAMENAFPEVKEKADFVTKSNDDDGVLNTIEKILSVFS